MIAVRRIVVLLAGLALLLPAAPLPAGAATSDRGPALRTPAATLRAAVACPGGVRNARPTVLLVHGTGATPRENWDHNLLDELPARGYRTCTVTLPERAFGDLQVSVEYVVFAIRSLYARSGKEIAVIGHRQGAFLSTYALRFWPDLAPKVADLIGYAGTYTYGSGMAPAEPPLRCYLRPGCS